MREGECEFVGVDGRVHRTTRSHEVDVELPGVETARGGTETACLSSAYSRDKSVGLFRVCLNVEGGGDKGNKNRSPQPSSVSGSPQPSSVSSKQNGKGKAKEVRVSPAGWRKLRFPTEDAAKAISPLSVGDRVVVSDPCPSGISGQSVCGKDAIFCGVESSSVVCVLVKTKSGKGWRPLHVHPSAVSLKSWYGLDVSGDFLHDDDKRKELVDDELDRFSDFSVDDEEEIDISADGGDLPEAVLSSSRAQAHLPQQVTQAAVRQLERVLAAARARSNGVSRRCHSWSGIWLTESPFKFKEEDIDVLLLVEGVLASLCVEGKTEALCGEGVLASLCGESEIEALCGGGETEALYGEGKTEALCGGSVLASLCGEGETEVLYGGCVLASFCQGGEMEALCGEGEMEALCGGGVLASLCGEGETEALYGGGVLASLCGEGETEALCGGGMLASLCGKGKTGTLCGGGVLASFC
uniref:Uncharacterized protein n=1 Tax=Chromera velia CCMP2878 TaxID=1169474 RepID=A0A0G4FWZ1_9ALVE|eukprot:Cvel_3813.t1-p1 / transcript=Cvel_3813.t1 / gene=Cvel_3813 / organism=Chromera_velia_CCMP2878 / gene_product=Uncharacterized protein LOC284861, putative / transcript_product=Uncharacterized protein LOC284861, putative / location=Cvel_scaffold160:106951-119328(+) / protein_length=468 / sequence_SO=supercontig / SO=protein_coding / is_pseudo=false